MIRPTDIEVAVIRALDRMVTGQPIEDDRIELKTDLPLAPKAARRIAGQANASRGEPVLWIIGADEKARSVPGIQQIEVSSWFNSVKSHFNEIAPELSVINVPYNGVTVVALYFTTERVPYVVANPGGGTVSWEVPYREATGIRSATRSNLVRLLSPLQATPTVEVLGAFVSARDKHKSQDGLKEYVTSQVFLALLVAQPSTASVILPLAKSDLTWHLSESSRVPYRDLIHFKGDKANGATVSSVAASLSGPAIIEVRGHIGVDVPSVAAAATATTKLSFSCSAPNVARPLQCEVILDPVTSGSPGWVWGWGNYQFLG